jgi:SAM-dependent methyltransferase
MPPRMRPSGGRVPTIEELDSRYYRTEIDDHTLFDRAVRHHLSAGALVLDAGAGRGVRYPYDYKERVRRLVGVDVDPNICQNRIVHNAVRGDLAHLPFRDATFDMIFSKYVFEHLREPLAAMRELRRVTESGGHLVIHTPNRYHYVALGAMLTPQCVHRRFNRLRGCEEIDTFPTIYKANDRRTLERLARSSGYRIEEILLLEPRPTYLFFHQLAYRAGIAYERLVARYEALQDLRCVIVATMCAVEEPKTEREGHNRAGPYLRSGRLQTAGVSSGVATRIDEDASIRCI